MSAQHEAVVVALTGQLAMVLVLAVPLAFLLSWLLLRNLSARRQAHR